MDIEEIIEMRIKKERGGVGVSLEKGHIQVPSEGMIKVAVAGLDQDQNQVLIETE